MTNPRLFVQIRTFDIDGGPVRFTFVQKLARENGWTVPRTEQVVEEYRKFLYLAMVADHPVSPSDSVDQAWHVHMLYTHSYWERLTKEILPRPLHHGPSKGGASETKKFDDWYAKTLDAYRAEFGYEPPDDVWPAVGRQFAGAEHFRRVDTSANWVVPRAAVRQGLFGFGTLLAAALTVVGCTTVLPLAQLGGAEIAAVVLVGGGVVVLVVIAMIVSRNRGAGQSDYHGGTGCTTMGMHTNVMHVGSDGHAGGAESGFASSDGGGLGHGASAGADIGGDMGAAAGGHSDSGGTGDSGGSDGGGGGDGGGGCGGGCGGGGD